jgi:hypothetical protein
VEKLGVEFLDELQNINSDEVKKEPKYMFAIHTIIQIYRVKYPIGQSQNYVII